MKITAFDISRFGLWQTLSMPNLEDGLNVFYGPNEAGKTTLLEFLRGQLYGFDNDRHRYVVHTIKPHSLSQPIEQPSSTDLSTSEQNTAAVIVPPPIAGGEMILNCSNGIFHLRRTFDTARPAGEEELVVLTGRDGIAQGEHLLNILVNGVDEPTYNNVFAIGLDELQRLSTLGDTEAADLLFRLSIGLDRVSLVDVLKELIRSRDRLLDVSGKPSKITRLIEERDKILEEVGKSRGALRDYAKLSDDRRQCDRQLESIETELAALQHETRLYETAARLIPVWDKRNDVVTRLGAMGNVVEITDAAIKKLETFETELAEQRRIRDQIKVKQNEIQQSAAALPINENLWRLSPRIEVLLEEEKRIIEIDQQITRCEQEISSLESELAEKESHLKNRRRPATNKVVMNRPPASVTSTTVLPQTTSSAANVNETVSGDERHNVNLDDFRVPAKALHNARQRFPQVKEEYEDLAERVKLLDEKVGGVLASRKVESIAEALEKTGEMLTQLRRREAAGRRLAEMVQHRKELERVNAFLIQNQALPIWMLAALFILVLLGTGLIGCAVMFPAYAFLGVVGALFVAGAIGGKISIEKTNGSKLQHNQRQLSLLLGQMEQAKREIDAVDAKFPNEGKTTEQQLQAAQDEMQTLEKLMPLESQWRDAAHQLKTAKQRYDEVKQELGDATKRWTNWLRVVGLPEDWAPAQIRDLIGRYDTVGTIRSELDHRYELMNQRIRDMRVITDRIDRMVIETGLTFPEGLSYVDLLEQVRQRLRENDESLAKREKFRKDEQVLRKEYRRVRNVFKKSQRALNSLLQHFGAKSPQDLRSLYEKFHKYRALHSEQESVQRELEAGLGGVCDELEIAKYLDASNREHLPNQLAQVRNRVEVTSSRLKTELETRGRIDEQLRILSEDKTPQERCRRLARVNDQISDAIKQWQSLAVTIKLLDEIRGTYERERQPQTLFEASELLREMTSGRYQRVWTPLGDETLYVDDADGNTLEVSWLSRGTREQLFIAIRLALTAAFFKHGTVLPMILDDVLVNFDSERAAATARLLKSVADSGRQVFLFTCHEHICRIFQRLEVPVRILPKFTDKEKKIRVLLPFSILKQKRASREILQQKIQDRRRRKRYEQEAKRRAEINKSILQLQKEATAQKEEDKKPEV
ncbi:MAG: AAA family ATPase [Planctomycetaceae bacterium]|jgi:uncharacterized protein YhaN|nr:AAA family ATPase [Planctomycetaceae bacterium]